MTKCGNLSGERALMLDPREELLNQVEAIEQQLADLRALLAAEPRPLLEECPLVLANRIRRQLKARRARTHFFGENLFADPAWDILLEAFATHLLQQRTSVTALCNAAAVPPTTALRWVNRLEEEQLLVRRDDPLDGRRSWIEISPRGEATMRRYLDSVSVTLPL